MFVDEAGRLPALCRNVQQMLQVLQLQHEMVIETAAPVGRPQAGCRIQFAQFEHRRGAGQVVVGQPDRFVGRGAQAVVQVDGGVVGGQFIERGRLGQRGGHVGAGLLAGLPGRRQGQAVREIGGTQGGQGLGIEFAVVQADQLFEIVRQGGEQLTGHRPAPCCAE